MTLIRAIDLADARRRVRGRTSVLDSRAPYREAIANMTDARMIELEPDTGETMRGLKLNVTRAAREVSRNIGYGESDSGTLLVWLESTKQRRGPRARKQRAANGT